MATWRDNPIEGSDGFRAWASSVEEDNHSQDADTRVWFGSDGSEVSIYDGAGGFALNAYGPTHTESTGSWLAAILGQPDNATSTGSTDGKWWAR
jgi:hypothetical protein